MEPSLVGWNVQEPFLRRRKKRPASFETSKKSKEEKLIKKRSKYLRDASLWLLCQPNNILAFSKRSTRLWRGQNDSILANKRKKRQAKTFKSSSKWNPHFFSKDANFLNCHLLGDLCAGYLTNLRNVLKYLFCEHVG